MHNTFLASLAAAHFAERPNQPLLAGIASRVNASNLIEALKSGCRPVQHIAWRRLVEMDDDHRRSLILQNLVNDSDHAATTVLFLRALNQDSIPVSDEICGRVISLLKSDQAEVRLAAAFVIALRKPEAALSMLLQQEHVDRHLSRVLCFADDPNLIVPLMRAFEFPAKPPPPTIGFPITPVWLGEHHAEHPEIVEWLIRNCGYGDDVVSPEMLNLLAGGFSYVTDRMTSEPRVLKVAHRWQRRIRSFVWRLLPDELDLQSDDDRPFDVANPLDVDLFIAAVRDSDRLTFLERKSLPPFSHEAMKREMTPVCYHASSRYVRRLFVDQPLEVSEHWKFPVERKGEFLFDNARVLLEPNDDLRTAADRQLREKFIAGRIV